MEYRTLGGSGLRVSLVGLGCNNFGRRIDYAASQPVVHKALDLGITLFDTADVYRSAIGGSEEFLGRALGPRRKDIVLATKVGMPMDDSQPGASRQIIIAGVEASLRRLNTEWIDLYQQHQPDPLTPIEETLRAFDDLIRQGKVRYHRLLQPEGLAGGGGSLDVAHAWAGAVRVVPGRIQPAGTARRSRADPDDADLRHGPAAVLSTGERRADRQVPSQRVDA